MQIKELHSLVEIGALTPEQYEDQRDSMHNKLSESSVIWNIGCLNTSHNIIFPSTPLSKHFDSQLLQHIMVIRVQVLIIYQRC